MGDTAVDSLTTYNNGIDSRKPFSNRSDVVPKSKSCDVRHGAGRVSERVASIKRYGIHPINRMGTAGFKYTGKEDTARCKTCGLEVSNWTLDMDPITVHSALSPSCPYVRSIKSPNLLTPAPLSSLKSQSSSLPPSNPSTSSASASTAIVRSASVSSEQENPSKRQKTEAISDNKHLDSVVEIDKIQQIRKRTFSHWPHRASPSQAQMIEAGFFNCNVGDRVICIYCNLICQQWTPHTDDPSDVHKTLSPNCPFVRSKLIRREAGSILIVNENNLGATSNSLEQYRCNEFVHTVACNAAYSELPKRMTSFASWSNENSPSVDDLVKAGFFYTGTKNIVTCFYCNGSLQNWGPNDNPTIEHARWFPHCAYAKQLCGDELYRKIQESKRAQQERTKANESKPGVGSGSNSATNQNSTTNSKQLLIPDESTLSRLVAARLDLPISQRLLNKNFKLSIIKRCFEDQLRLKHDDFATDADLHMACMILQKQIEHIDGKKENITIPSIKMKKIREDAEREQADTHAQEQNMAAATSTVPQATATTASASTITTDVEMTVSSQSATNESTSSIESTSQRGTTGNHEETKATKPSTSGGSENNQTNDSSPANPCVLCLSEEKRLACIPCGHLATCVPCGHSLRSCPICRREIEAFVRIYV